MAEKQVTQDAEAVEVTVDTEFSKKDLMQRFEIKSENTLKRWCEVTGVDWSPKFTPEDVQTLQHLAYHVREQGLTMNQYEDLLRGGDSPQGEANESHGRYTSQSESEQGSQVSEIIEKRYQGTIDAMAKPVARAFWESFDAAVLREVALIASTETVPTRIEQNVLPAFVERELTAWLLPPASEEVGC